MGGGDYSLMERVLIRSEKGPLKEADRRYVAFRVHMEKAGFEREFAKRNREALRFAVQAHSVCPSTEALWLASESGYDLEDWQAVRELMNSYLAIEPVSLRAITKRGFASENLGDSAKAIDDYMRAIKLGDALAMNRVGWFYETSRYLPRDLTKARALYEQAAAKGNPTAKDALAKMQLID